MALFDDLRIFERVGTLRSFAEAAKELGEPRSNVSRSVARLEARLGMRLLQRTTRDVTLTPAGESLLSKCSAAVGDLTAALAYVGSLATEAQGDLRISVGIGFGINVLSEQLPEFLERYPGLNLDLDLTSRVSDLIADRVDVAIRFGELGDSSMVAVRLGEMKSLICAAPRYLERRGTPSSIADFEDHDIIDMPGPERQSRPWSLSQNGQTCEIALKPRVSANDALTIHRLVLNGAGVGIVSCYLCAPDIETGRLIHLLPDWELPTVPVNILFPSRRELAPSVRAFVDYLKASNPRGTHWQNNVVPFPQKGLIAQH